MRIKTIKYCEFQGTAQEWVLESLKLSERMLIVGKNASGKTRALNIIGGLANSLLGLKPPGVSGDYAATFDFDGRSYVYEMSVEESFVVHERIVIDGKDYLTRGVNGSGKILAEKIGTGMEIDFQVPTNVFAAVAKRDAIQHSFIEPLIAWADFVRHYQFGQIFQAALAIIVPNGLPVNDRDQNAVVGIFREGQKLFQAPFVDAIKEDLARVGYNVDSIGLGPPLAIRFDPTGPQPVSLNVKESELAGVTDQISMSTGMYRVLALLVHVNFARFKGSTSCVLVDDIGEGLDFDRSCRLIDLLREKSERYGFQLVMTTNDKFVMNNVPLEEWTVLHRSNSTVHVRNNENSRAAFDDFKFTGLSNFSFFEMNAVDMTFGGCDEASNA